MSTRTNACPSTVLLVERALPAVFPLQATSLEAMREISGLHEKARRRLADIALPPELRVLLSLDDDPLHAALRRALAGEAEVLEHMAPEQIVWHVLTAAARLLG
ncbi:MAG TPA: hypothetical protein PKV72_01355 [Candidatus Peribacteria bacterium]|nr:hypothetical protein [Candidatus Peribacteria bacterium]